MWVAIGDEERLFARGASGMQDVDWILPGASYAFRLRGTDPATPPLASTTVVMAAAPPRQVARPAAATAPQDGLPDPLPPRSSPETAPNATTVPPLEEARSAALPSRRRAIRKMFTRPAPRKTKAFIRAEPNPIPVGPGLGSTTIRWSTGNGKVGTIFLVASGGEEIPFQQGAEGSHLVNWIQRDVVYRFQLYEDRDQRVRLAATTVTMGNERLEIARDVAFLAGLVAVPVALLAAAVGTGLRLTRWAARIRGPRGRSPLP